VPHPNINRFRILTSTTLFSSRCALQRKERKEVFRSDLKHDLSRHPTSLAHSYGTISSFTSTSSTTKTAALSYDDSSSSCVTQEDASWSTLENSINRCSVQPPQATRSISTSTQEQPKFAYGYQKAHSIEILSTDRSTTFDPPTLYNYIPLERTHCELTKKDSKTAGLIVRNVTEALVVQKNLDFKFIDQTTMWKCFYAATSTIVFFVVRLWKRIKKQDPNMVFVLEFQRYNGDHPTFYNIFHSTLRSLGEPAHQNRKCTTFPSVGMETPLTGGEKAKNDFPNLIEHVVNMIRGGFLDMVLEGTRVLAHLTTMDNLSDHLKRADAMQVLLNFLLSTSGLYDTVRRDENDHHILSMSWTFAVTCIANMSQEVHIHDLLFKGNIMKLLLKLVDNGLYFEKAMRREAARTLLNLAEGPQGVDKIFEVVNHEELKTWISKTLKTIKVKKDEKDEKDEEMEEYVGRIRKKMFGAQ